MTTNWHKKWESGDIGFHYETVNPLLEKYYAHIQTYTHIFVPLCGKTGDMKWLADRGHHITGIDCVESAIQSFFEPAEPPVQPSQAGQFRMYYHNRITLYAGDFFAVTPDMIPQTQLIYDRAALIALSADQREVYYNSINQLLARGCSYFLITRHKVPESGPPFYVSDTELSDNITGLVKLGHTETETAYIRAQSSVYPDQ